MPPRNIFHALGLHMHQPPGNLRLLIDANPWEAEQIIRCYERAARYARKYPVEARLHVGFSGILLEQFRDPEIIDRYRHIVDLPAMLDSYREAANVELIGMGYYHPIFPLIPRADWEEQLSAGRAIMQEAFGRSPKGFWPPEMAFSMEMIPALVKAGYEYVVVDGVHVQPADGSRDIYRPYRACHEGACITVVPRDRDVSNAQESGLNPSWFANEVRRRVAESPRPLEPRLVTTWSDGENGGWFRQTHEEAGFFGHYFAPYLEHVRSGEYPILPVSLSDYLREHPATAEAQVQTGAWNVGDTSGYDLRQWAGSDSQRQAVATVERLSARYWRLRGDMARLPPNARKALKEARKLLLEAETSCYLFWGESWIPHLYARSEPATRLLERAEAQRLPEATAKADSAAAPIPPIPAAPPPTDSGPRAAAPATTRALPGTPGTAEPPIPNRSKPTRPEAGNEPVKPVPPGRRKSEPPVASEPATGTMGSPGAPFPPPEAAPGAAPTTPATAVPDPAGDAGAHPDAVPASQAAAPAPPARAGATVSRGAPTSPDGANPGSDPAPAPPPAAVSKGGAGKKAAASSEPPPPGQRSAAKPGKPGRRKRSSSSTSEGH